MYLTKNSRVCEVRLDTLEVRTVIEFSSLFERTLNLVSLLEQKAIKEKLGV